MSPRSEISSLTTSLDDLTRRVTAMAETAHAGGDAEAASELFAVERALLGALRRLSHLSTDRR
jgi:hypothetical protein